MEIGDVVKLTSETIPVELDTSTGVGFIRGRVINKIIFHIVIECEDGTIVEGDEMDLFVGRCLKLVRKNE